MSKKTDIMYKSNISDERWIAYDIPGNIGWIAYFVGFGKLIAKGHHKAAAVTGVPAALMATGICELVSERIAGLDRKLPIERLQRGFGALTVGGATGVVAGLVAGSACDAISSEFCRWRNDLCGSGRTHTGDGRGGTFTRRGADVCCRIYSDDGARCCAWIKGSG